MPPPGSGRKTIVASGVTTRRRRRPRRTRSPALPRRPPNSIRAGSPRRPFHGGVGQYHVALEHEAEVDDPEHHQHQQRQHHRHLDEFGAAVGCPAGRRVNVAIMSRPAPRRWAGHTAAAALALLQGQGRQASQPWVDHRKAARRYWRRPGGGNPSRRRGHRAITPPATAPYSAVHRPAGPTQTPSAAISFDVAAAQATQRKIGKNTARPTTAADSAARTPSPGQQSVRRDPSDNRRRRQAHSVHAAT